MSRYLILDHFFDQDIEALWLEAGDEVELDVLDYMDLRSEALRVLPEEVASGLEAWAAPELEPQRARYAAILREILEDRFADAPFDALVVPSDVFFYVRAAPEIVHDLGVPFFVAQKETTISDHTMREHAPRVARYAPTLADRMTVCSERHKAFWVRAGADPETIVVTGQPRFDFYRRPERWPAPSGERTVLFLSYFIDAYHPSEGTGGAAWADLHRQTEAGLFELARRGWRVFIKPHPQQGIDAVQAWREHAGDLWGDHVHLSEPSADVRDLIVTADAVVGFQSTAMLEAMLAGKPTLYTAWDPEAEALAGELIPFHDWTAELDVVRRAEDLPGAIEASVARAPDPAIQARRVEIAESFLGPLDGGASRRTLDEIARTAAAFARERSPEVAARREQLAARRPPLRIGRRARSSWRRARRRVGAALGR